MKSISKGGRKLGIKIINTYNEYNYINCGVPQSTVLGLILFLLYVNNRGNWFNNWEVICYVYDRERFLKQIQKRWGVSETGLKTKFG